MFDEHAAGIEQAVETVTEWLNGTENPLTWNPPRYAELWRWCLSHNLAIAAGLCRAWLLGVMAQDYAADGGDKARYWVPGCGRSAP